MSGATNSGDRGELRAGNWSALNAAILDTLGTNVRFIWLMLRDAISPQEELKRVSMENRKGPSGGKTKKLELHGI